MENLLDPGYSGITEDIHYNQDPVMELMKSRITMSLTFGSLLWFRNIYWGFS